MRDAVDRRPACFSIVCVLAGWTATARTAHAEDAVGDVTRPGPLAAERFEVGGRVFVRETAASTQGAAWAGTLAVASARLELRYRFEDLRAVVELEAADGHARLRDAYLRLE